MTSTCCWSHSESTNSRCVSSKTDQSRSTVNVSNCKKKTQKHEAVQREKKLTDHPEWTEQEVKQIHSARVLDVILQLRLQGTQNPSEHTNQTTRLFPQSHDEDAPTSWLKACLNICRQRTNSSSPGGLERSVRTPSGGQKSWKVLRWAEKNLFIQFKSFSCKCLKTNV